VVLTIWRDGEMLTKEVSLREMELPEPEILDFDIDPVDPDELFEEQNPEDYGIEEQSFEVGFTVRALSGIHQDDEFRMIIRSVDRESEAWNRGLRADYQILEINGEQVTSLRQFEEVLFESFQSNGSVSLKTLTPNSVTAYFVLNW